MENNLFCLGDILQMPDKSQWEVEDLVYDNESNKAVYILRSVRTGKTKRENALDLSKKAIITQFADPIPKPKDEKSNVIYLADHRNKVIG